jgi:RimJ/RimL family protein N-acetyltransferase
MASLGDRGVLTIRTATAEDAAELLGYVERLLAEDLPGIFRRRVPSLAEEYEFIASRTRPEKCTLLVAVLDGRVVGVADFIGQANQQERHAGTFGISMDRSARGLGIGTALIEALVAWAREHGITRIQGWAFSSNPRAVALYERLGFAREGVARQAIEVDGELIDAILIARLLEH